MNTTTTRSPNLSFRKAGEPGSYEVRRNGLYVGIVYRHLRGWSHSGSLAIWPTRDLAASNLAFVRAAKICKLCGQRFDSHPTHECESPLIESKRQLPFLESRSK